MVDDYELLPMFPREELVAKRIADDADPLGTDPAQWPRVFGPPTTGMYHHNVDAPADELTEVFAFFNDSHLGFAVICHDYEKEEFSEGKAGYTIYSDEDAGVDIFFDPGLSGQGVVKLSSNPAGGRVQVAYAPGTPYYPYRWQNRSFVTPDCWGTVCWLEFQDVGLKARDGDVWGLNIVRRDGLTKSRSVGVSLAPNFDFFKFPEQLCRLRFGEPSPLGGVELDQSTPGVARLRMALAPDDRIERLTVELRPCWGEAQEKSLAPAATVECAFAHGIAERSMCELRVSAMRGAGSVELGRYRFHTPNLVAFRLDRRGHRYGPEDAHLTATVEPLCEGLAVEALDLYRLEGDDEERVRTVDVHGRSETQISLEGLPCGAYALRGRCASSSVMPEVLFNKVPIQPPPVKEHGNYLLSELTDFPDDVGWNYFDWPHFEQYFDYFRELGVQRVFWMDYGSPRDTWHYVRDGHSRTNGEETYKRVGDYVNAARLAVKQRGMEFFATIKPLETGIRGRVVPEGSPDADGAFVLEDMVGGVEVSPCEELRDYPDMFFKRRNWKPPYRGVVSEIRLYHTDDRPLNVKPSDLTLWVSEDNLHYTKLDRAYTTEEAVQTRNGRACRYIAFTNLDLTERYVALTCSHNDGSFVNRMAEMAEMLDAEGNPIEISVAFDYHIVPRPTRSDAELSGTIRFGNLGHGVIAGQLVEDTFQVLNDPDRTLAIGIARGNDRHQLIPDPSEPDGLRFLLSRVRRVIKAGVDGIHFRLQHHGTFAEPQTYGYSKAVVEEYWRRHGVDITEAMPDRAKFEKIHGEFYTQFYCRARELADRAGVNLFLGVPEVQGFMCELPVKLEWERWITLGLADAIMLKNVYPGTMLGEALRVLTRRHGLPLYMNTYDCWGRGPKQEQRYRRFLQRSLEAGHDGYNRYEGLMVLRRGQPDTDEPDFVIRFSDAEKKVLRECPQWPAREGRK